MTQCLLSKILEGDTSSLSDCEEPPNPEVGENIGESDRFDESCVQSQ